jgi:hypothetical protein
MGRAEAVDGARQERLEAQDLGPAGGVQFGDFHNPNALPVDRGIVEPEPGSSSVNHCAPASTLIAVDLRALRPFEDQPVVGLHAGTEDAGDGRDEPERADGVVERAGLGW